ncbi:YafY family protein [Paenibacillus sp. JX-17]|uniref:YafY family protein n=1 Tax=Paenibacillus lacisoli TaxID=3064525 RepID=A0ABT9CE49_9BACL|nr:YafY family protein [Paenibacillus sp. JX-17]MDO7907522.1 YafY family protein [Paenibacillus sp. JX-17]
MKKSERLHDMMRYLNNREFFNLNDLMQRYHISKSTALRDIASLEQLGMPIYAEHGRNGRYGILRNTLLSPIVFTMDEVYALYFAMLTLEAYQSTPFHLSVNTLNEKFESCLSEKQIRQIHQMRKVLQLESYPHAHISSFLDQILQSILHECRCTIQYSKQNQTQAYQTYEVQFIKISARFGQWYAGGIESDTGRYRVFRCDRITGIQEEEGHSQVSVDELLRRSQEGYRSEGSIEFEVEIREQARDLYYKEPYPSMRLEDGETTLIRGFYNPGEEGFIADYFIRFGEGVLSVKPETLKQVIQERVERMLRHYRGLY